MYIAIATHILNMIRDAFAPYGHPNSPYNWGSSWVVSLLFVSPLIFTALEQTPEGCTRCALIEPSLGKMWMFQWSEYLYVAIVPLLAMWFYRSKYEEHQDYEALHKAGKATHGNNEAFILSCTKTFEPSLQRLFRFLLGDSFH